MQLTARERQVVTLLLAASSPLTQASLAEATSVSLRTIQRDLKGIEKELAKINVNLERLSDQTVQLRGDTHVLSQYVKTDTHRDYTSDERQQVLLVRLLQEREPVKLFTLASELRVTAATISSDLDKASQWLETYGLQVVRKRGYGIEIQGAEERKRRALSGIISIHFNESELYEVLYEEKVHNQIAERLLHIVDVERVKEVSHVIQTEKPALFPHIADQSLIALVVHTTLAVKRLELGEIIMMDADQLEALRKMEEFEVASMLARALEKQMNIRIPDEEVGYLAMHLRGARISGSQSLPFEEQNAELIGRIKTLIYGVEKELNTSIYGPTLVQDLLAHLKPALYRIRQGMHISNPLLQRLQNDYETLFNIVRGQAQVAFEPLQLPDEEIGYLCLHFGSVLERRKRSHHVSALVICPSGIGSAKMLASRIEQEIPEISTIKNASLLELSKEKANYDVIISTVNIDDMDPVFHVSPVLTEQEVKEIRQYIRGLPTKNPSKTHDQSVGAKVAFQHISSLSTMMERLLDSIRFFSHRDMWQGIEESVKEMHRLGYVNHIDAVVMMLKDRERVGGLAIPNTDIALYHGRDDAIRDPFFNVIDLEEARSLPSMVDGHEWVERIVVYAAPKEITPHHLSFLSYVSTLFIGSEQDVKVFSEGKRDELLALLEEKAKQYLINFIREGD
ncbi:BglG family transcription antiterminator [Geomicrobium sp. JCM 19055]|uniref:BglG family transcription antiterminator n=1 Tax=Geomicrobium sp. JCM 19055 TaxID=1460649 RepID=UPI00045EDDBD|nr:BglG family transcription antiterminator [Geomicrobium sp. JCM 19055]GAJ98251.1 mannitol operon activator, BglG family [Geomicrobium sp. JCM 19055]